MTFLPHLSPASGPATTAQVTDSKGRDRENEKPLTIREAHV